MTDLARTDTEQSGTSPPEGQPPEGQPPEGRSGGDTPPPAEQAGGGVSPPADNGWRRDYWRRNLRLMVILLSIWFVVSFGFGILLVEPLNEIVINDFPLGFWFAQQGSIYTFVVLILVYALTMDRLDRRFGVDERVDEPTDEQAGEQAAAEGGRS